jgi:hypothetical protein
MTNNGQFVDNLLEKIDSHIEQDHRSFVQKVLMKIRGRSKIVYTDPMWFIIALKIRHEGLAWSEMDKYGVKKDNAGS